MSRRVTPPSWWARNGIGRTKASREIPISVLRALVLLGGTSTAYKIASIMVITTDEAERRLSTWIEVGAVAKRGDRYQLLPEPREPSAPRRSRRWVEHRLYIPARYRGAP